MRQVPTGKCDVQPDHAGSGCKTIILCAAENRSYHEVVKNGKKAVQDYGAGARQYHLVS
jgi:hypothetical protein